MLVGSYFLDFCSEVIGVVFNNNGKLVNYGIVGLLLCKVIYSKSLFL